MVSSEEVLKTVKNESELFKSFQKELIYYDENT